MDEARDWIVLGLSISGHFFSWSDYGQRFSSDFQLFANLHTFDHSHDFLVCVCPIILGDSFTGTGLGFLPITL
jgi:hypothetical protein